MRSVRPVASRTLPQVYLGPIGRKGRDLIRYLESVPGMPAWPRGMNPASWMLDGLQGLEGSVTKREDAAAAATAPGAVGASSASLALARSRGVNVIAPRALTGAELQAKLHASAGWEHSSKRAEASSVATSATDSLRYARSLPVAATPPIAMG